MSESRKSAALAQAAETIEEIRQRLGEVSAHLANGQELAAIDALSGLAAHVVYVETLLTIVHNQPPTSARRSCAWRNRKGDSE